MNRNIIIYGLVLAGLVVVRLAPISEGRRADGRGDRDIADHGIDLKAAGGSYGGRYRLN